MKFGFQFGIDFLWSEQIVNNDNFSISSKENWKRGGGLENWNWQKLRGWDFDKSIKSLLFSQTNKHAAAALEAKKEMHSLLF